MDAILTILLRVGEQIVINTSISKNNYSAFILLNLIKSRWGVLDTSPLPLISEKAYNSSCIPPRVEPSIYPNKLTMPFRYLRKTPPTFMGQKDQKATYMTLRCVIRCWGACGVQVPIATNNEESDNGKSININFDERLQQSAAARDVIMDYPQMS